MGPATQAVPKSLLPLGGRPVLAHQIDQLRAAGVQRVIVLAGHLAGPMRAAAIELARPELDIEVRVEPTRLGSGGCLSLVRELDCPAIVVFGDIMFDVDLGALLASHARAGAAITAAVHPNEHPHDSDLVGLDAHGRVVALHAKPHPPGARLPNLVTAGLFVIAAEFLAKLPPAAEARKRDLVQDLVSGALAAGVHVNAWRTTHYLKDMGTPKRYAEAEADLAARVPARRRRARATVFLDRDGTLNAEVGHLARPEQLRLLPGVGAAVAALNHAQLQAVVVTNQPVLARGEVDEAGLRAIHAELDTQLGRAGAYLDALYYCPHHPDAGFAGERAELKRPCACRKPGVGLIERAMEELDIEMESSVLIGDHPRDWGAARAAGLRPLAVGEGARREAAAHEVEWFVDLPAAVHALLHSHVPHTHPPLATIEEHAC